jgi:NAD(P)-dependent dehydrogenase (short-subunit alcohol dehydrogenase family)
VSGRSLEGRRTVVVGASSGIGRAIALHAVAAGARLVGCGRRADALAELVTEAGGGTVVVADVRDADGRRALLEAAVGELGEIDLLVNTAGVAELRFLRDVDDVSWLETFSANVVAHNELLKAAVPHMSGHGIVCVLSSETATRPRHGLIPYGASKAALEASMAGWRLEHPEVRFTSVVVGATSPTDFARDFDGDVLSDALERWGEHGLIQADAMTTDDVAGVLVGTLGAALAHPSVGIETFVVRSPSPVVRSFGG